MIDSMKIQRSTRTIFSKTVHEFTSPIRDKKELYMNIDDQGLTRIELHVQNCGTAAAILPNGSVFKWSNFVTLIFSIFRFVIF